MFRPVRHDAVRAWRHGSRILVPEDFSPHSEHALRYAAAFAVRLDAPVEVFHVVEEP